MKVYKNLFVDQGTIILQNIKHSKKKFDFNIFKKLPNVEEDINFKSVSKRVDKNLSVNKN